jgi:hypothetical protein
MDPGDLYRVKAAELHAKALHEPKPDLKREYEALARSYLRLSEQANRNALTDVSYEPPPVSRPSRRDSR